MKNGTRSNTAHHLSILTRPNISTRPLKRPRGKVLRRRIPNPLIPRRNLLVQRPHPGADSVHKPVANPHVLGEVRRERDVRPREVRHPRGALLARVAHVVVVQERLDRDAEGNVRVVEERKAVALVSPVC